MLCKPLETCAPGLKIGPNFSRMLIELPNGKENRSQIFWLTSGDPPPSLCLGIYYCIPLGKGCMVVGKWLCRRTTEKI